MLLLLAEGDVLKVRALRRLPIVEVLGAAEMKLKSIEMAKPD